MATSPATAETMPGRHQLLSVAGIAVLAMLCWGALVAWPTSGLIVCGAKGAASFVPVWDIGRAASLVTMWVAMSGAMMLPCTAIEIVRTRTPVRAALTAALSGAALIALLVAPIEWALESLRVMDNGLLAGGAATQAALLAIGGAAVALHLGIRVRMRGAAAAAMVSLQLAGGAMNMGWTLAVAAGMAALTVISAPGTGISDQNATLIKSSRLIQTG